MLGNLNKDGYIKVIVRGIKTDFVGYSSHRLVYETFNGSIPNGLVIDHINGIKTDNRLENLELVTQQENTRRGNTGNYNNFSKVKPIVSINLKTGDKLRFPSMTF